MTTHRSRTFWPKPLGPREEKGAEPAKTMHSHKESRQPRVLWVVAFVCIVILSIVCGLLTVYAVRVDARIAALEEYVEGKGEQRDREAAALEKLMRELDRQSACDLLDQFPEGGWLDRPREKYNCGPGIPIEELTPEEQEQLEGRGQANIDSSDQTKSSVPERGQFNDPSP